MRLLAQVRDGKAAYYIRAALLGAGFPVTTCASHSARFCSSGLTATQHIANEVMSGTIDIGALINIFKSIAPEFGIDN